MFISERIPTEDPEITILLRGVFWINQIATKKFFGKFKRVFLLYDKERRAIGFQSTDEQRGTYCFSKAKSRNDGYVSGITFLKYYKISYDERKSYKANWNKKEKLVEIDLNYPKRGRK